jgi:RepB DNA-primase from phage plasmid
MAVVDDRGFFLTLQAVSRQLAAMPNQLYLVRLIHHATRRALPGERLWTATQLVNPVTVRFLRARNRDGCDVYVLPYAGPQNAGYILVDLDGATPTVVETMRAHGHAPCLVVQTSPGHLQTWIRLSATPLEPALATAAGKQLARAYGGDLASSDWRHLGRLVGFTNQKPARRTPGGYAPWVKIVYAHPGLAPCADTLLHSLLTPAALTPPPLPVNTADFPSCAASPSEQTATSTHPSASEAVEIYSRCVNQWRIRERFPHPDWSIVDLWVARHLPVPISLAVTPIPTTTCEGPLPTRWLFLFPAPAAPCVRLIGSPPLHPPYSALVQTPPGEGNPATSAAASGCRPAR